MAFMPGACTCPGHTPMSGCRRQVSGNHSVTPGIFGRIQQYVRTANEVGVRSALRLGDTSTDREAKPITEMVLGDTLAGSCINRSTRDRWFAMPVRLSVSARRVRRSFAAEELLAPHENGSSHL